MDEELSLLEDKQLEEDALLKICRLKMKQHWRNMNVMDTEYQFDFHKLFSFEAEGRVDFCELICKNKNLLKYQEGKRQYQPSYCFISESYSLILSIILSVNLVHLN